MLLQSPLAVYSNTAFALHELPGMSSYDDTEAGRRHKPPYTSHHGIPTIQKYREEQKTRQEVAREHDHHASDNADKEKPQTASGAEENGEDSHGKNDNNDDDGEPAIDTSQVDSSSTDPRARRKNLKNRKDEKAEREVTDPVTHLPVTIHDKTSSALKEVSKNDLPFGSTPHTSTGQENKKKSGKQLHTELKDLQNAHESLQALFPPPNFESMKRELADLNKLGMTVGLTGAAAILALAGGIEKMVRIDRIASNWTSGSQWSVSIAIWLVLAALTVGAITALIFGVRDWMNKRIDSLWEDEVWDTSGQDARENKARETETVAWLNALLGSVWPLINPDLFISLADTLEDVMQASLPNVVKMVSVNDIGQGSEAVRILGIKWLPTGAAARTVTEDGKIQKSNQSNDRKVPGEGQVDDKENDNDNGKNGDQYTQEGDDGSQQQVAEGLEAEEGDFINMEVAFAYRANSSKRTMKDRAKDLHLYMAFYLYGNTKIPVWVDLRGIVGTMRLRLQLCPDPPFFSLCTLTFLGQPKVELSCTPLTKHALNIMDIPLISNFVQSAVDAAMAEYVAPKSLSLDLKDMIAGDDFKKDTNARGVLVVNVKRGYEFKTGDAGIPLIKDGSSDPYVSVGWAKFGKPVWSTRLLLKEMEPWWDETAYILVTPEELNVNERLRLQLWDSDRMTADDDLGRIEVDLKELMKNDESNGKMMRRKDGFRSLSGGKEMPGKLEWSVGYFAKTDMQADQLQRQSFDSNVRSMDGLKEKVNNICERKLREASIKEGRHKKEADELEQQRAQEMKDISDAMMISAPPPDGYPSGIFSIQIHQIIGLELESVSKTATDKEKEGNDEQEEGEGLPSAYCTVIINHNKAFKTRTKPKNAKPFYNASTERFIGDWRNAEVFVSVRDARVSEDNPLLGIVHLPLGEIFKERSQINGFYPLAGGIGYGRIRLSMVWRSVQLQAPPEALAWEHGTVEIQTPISNVDVPENLQGLKLKFHTDLGSGKMYPNKEGKESGQYRTKRDQSLKLPVRRKYSSCLAIQFRHHGMFTDNTAGFAVLWLKDLVCDEEREVELTVWKGDFGRATTNVLPESGEKLGTMKLKLTFWNGLGAAHSHWARKDPHIHEVVEVLSIAHDNSEENKNEQKVGIVDADASDSSDDDDDAEENGDASPGTSGPLRKLKDYKKHEEGLNRSNRGMMQWKFPRTMQWAAHKVEKTEHKFTGMFKHHSRESGVETEV